MKKIIAISFAFILLIVIGFFVNPKLPGEKISQNPISGNTNTTRIKTEEKYFILPVNISAGSTLSVLMQEAGVREKDIRAIIQAAQDVYDLSNIREGRTIYLSYKQGTENLAQFMYPISSEEELYVKRTINSQQPTDNEEHEWLAERKVIEYKVQQVLAEGVIKTSLYEAGLEQGLNESTIIELSNVFQWSLDFAYDIRAGDKFIFVFQKRYRDGKYIDDGRILAAHFINAGTLFQAYYFEEEGDNTGYFDQDANSIQKLFLKAPVAYKHISSGFTSGLRYIQAFDVSTGHRAIDYAASYGTPIRAVGDGTVVFATWSKEGYGYLTSVRHNATYTTNYAHQSKIMVRVGQKVKQGQTIGLVGSTGFSTGPHVHFELVRNGVKVNPLSEILPPGKPIKQENKERFFQSIEKYREMLATMKRSSNYLPPK